MEPLAEQIMRKVKQVAELYHRLILVIAPAGAGKTTMLWVEYVIVGIDNHLLVSDYRPEFPKREAILRFLKDNFWEAGDG